LVDETTHHQGAGTGFSVDGGLATEPHNPSIVYSDQGSQYTSHDWPSFLSLNGLEGSMNRRGNCNDNAVAESFFQRLKR
jgi:putative transposase